MLAKTGYKSRVDLAVNAKTIGLVVHEGDRMGTVAGSVGNDPQQSEKGR